jgi:perosamine synthetase
MIDDFVAFVRDVYKSDEYIPLHEPRFGAREKELVLDCIESTFVSSVGKYVDLFEEKICEYTGSKYAVAVVNGTLALYTALKLIGAAPETEVITQSLTFVATANAISYTGAQPVFVDVDKNTMGMSPSSLQSFLVENTCNESGICINKKSNKKIIACVPMHTFGLPCQIEEIRGICDEYNLKLVEDAAESLGSQVSGQSTGTFGEIGVLSFNGNKILTTGGGGMILFKDKKLALEARHLTTTAKLPHSWEFIHDMIGYNFRLPNLNAALGVAQLESLPVFLEKKRKLCNRYNQFFQMFKIPLFSEQGGTVSNYWLNAIQLENRKDRDQFLKHTNDHGIMTRGLWTPMHQLSMYCDCQKTDLDNTEYLFDRVVNIPSSVVN